MCEIKITDILIIAYDKLFLYNYTIEHENILLEILLYENCKKSVCGIKHKPLVIIHTCTCYYGHTCYYSQKHLTALKICNP